MSHWNDRKVTSVVMEVHFVIFLKIFRDLSVLAVHVLTGLYTTQQKKY